MDKTLKFIWIAIVITTIIIFSVSTVLFIKSKAENKPFEIHQNVCFMPRACFDTEQEFKDQFPGKEVPENYPECLVYCTKSNLNSELYPIQ